MPYVNSRVTRENGTPTAGQQGGDGTACARLGEKSGYHGRRHRRGGYGQLGRGRRNGYPEASAREVASRLPQGLELDDS